MAVITSKVYDVVYPSPIPLLELSAIAVAIELWRLDLKQYLKKNDFEKEFHMLFDSRPRITLTDVIPGIPSVIKKIIEMYYIERLIPSTYSWLSYNFEYIFRFHRDNHKVILKDFDDIVCDWDGAIDYVRTAKRMMHCDQISQDEKFKIACAYSFEDDIRQIGPSVLNKLDCNNIDFVEHPHLYYWVCCLRNEMDKIPNEGNIPIGELMLENTQFESRSSLEYFWKLAGLESRYQKAKTLCNHSLSFCGRFVLPMLNEEQLTEFVAEKGEELVYYSWITPEIREVVLGIWMYIKDKTKEANFISLIEKMLSSETDDFIVNDSTDESSRHQDQLYNNEILLTCCEIWDSAADNLKQLTIKNLLSKKWVLRRDCRKEPRAITFLLRILLDATQKHRSMLWSTNWVSLLASTRTTDLHQIMKLCFANEDEITLFKQNTMAKYENIATMVENFFKNGYIEELNVALEFICPDDVHVRRNLKQQCLQYFLSIDFSWYNHRKILHDPTLLHEFIDDAYTDNSNLATNFRNQMLYGNKFNLVLHPIRCSNESYLMKFVDSFASRGHNVGPLKEYCVDIWRMVLIEGSICDEVLPHIVEKFLLWGLGSGDRVIEFKQSISPDEVLHNMLKKEKSSSENTDYGDGLFAYPCALDGFLFWYFDGISVKIDEFKAGFVDVFKMFRPPRPRWY